MNQKIQMPYKSWAQILNYLYCMNDLNIKLFSNHDFVLKVSAIYNADQNSVSPKYLSSIRNTNR